ncbi:MAG: carbohydrate-binding domain-containing protein [Clostridiales bacterium]|jgi:hypothetical protein|nr:carbohydrate-binding domain-containing protein [Clostridiales bacterium]
MRKHLGLGLKVSAIALSAALAFTGYAGRALTANAATAAATSVKAEDTDASWDAAAAVKITLNGASATAGGAGAEVKGGVVTISKAGTYVISGKLTNGQIAIAAAKTDTVRLVLNGAEIKSAAGAPIYASQCGKLIVTLAEGTANTITDGGVKFAYAKADDEEPNAALFAKNDLTINGKGTLAVNAGFKNGIAAKDNLIIASGDITVNAANHGIRGNDSVTILGGAFNIKAGNDGIQTNNETEADKGWIAISGGTFSVTAAHDGLQADTTLNISAGTFSISAGGGAEKKLTITDGDAASTSYKGVKASGNLTISGGAFTLDSYDDAVHSGAAITISGGGFTIATGDDGMHADGDLTIKSGEINVKRSYEGLEGDNVYIGGGDISIVSSDDGINAAGGADGSGFGGRLGGDKFAAGGGMSGQFGGDRSGGGSHSLNISGGTVKVVASSDGLDSNGTITISGGTVVTQAIPARDGDAIDADGTVTFTGGTIVYAGTLSTGVNPTGNSTQSYVYTAANVAAGSVVTVKQNGKTLITYKPDAAVKVLALSSPDIKSGQSYDIYNGDTKLAAVTAGTGGGGMRGGPGGGFGDGGTGSGGFGGQAPGGAGQRPGRGR